MAEGKELAAGYADGIINDLEHVVLHINGELQEGDCDNSTPCGGDLDWFVDEYFLETKIYRNVNDDSDCIIFGVITTGGPHCEVENSQGEWRLATYWGGDKVHRYGASVRIIGEYLEQYAESF